MTKCDRPDPMTPLTITDEASADLDILQREAYAWIVRFMSGGMTPAEVDAMKAWFRQSKAHASAYAEARRMWNALGPIADARTHSGDLVSLDDNVARFRRSLSTPVGRRMFLGGAVAASAAYVVAKPPLNVWPSWSELMADYRTGAGEQRQVTLADATSLDLNTRTSIAVRAQTSASTRIELISGEATIATNAASVPLTVIAASGHVVATQAEFNLRCNGPDVSVACLKGSLIVQHNGADRPLGFGQQLTYNNQGVGPVTRIDLEAVTAWHNGLLIFDSTPVSEVIAEVNRYRASRIVLMNDNIGRRLLTARLKTTETDSIVVQIERIFGAKVHTLPAGIVLLT